MSELGSLWNGLRVFLGMNPLATVVAVALIAAWFEQRYRRKTAADLTSAYRGMLEAAERARRARRPPANEP